MTIEPTKEKSQINRESWQFRYFIFPPTNTFADFLCNKCEAVFNSAITAEAAGLTYFSPLLVGLITIQ